MRVCLFSIVISFIFSMCAQGQSKALAHTDFRKADSIAARCANYSLKNPGKLAARLTTPLQTEEEKFRAIYKWVCDNIEYDYSLFLKNKQKLKLKDTDALAEWNKNFSTLIFKNLRDRQKTVCTGYAYLVKTLASHAGIKCVIVDGYGRTTQSNIAEPGNANHSWNAVRLNNKWYLCDATWSSGAYNARTSKFEKNFNEVYFLSDPSTFVRNHFPLNLDWILLKEKPTLREFLTRPIIYSSFYPYHIDNILPETFTVHAIKGETTSFHVTTKAGGHPIEKIELQIQKANATQLVLPKFFRTSNGYSIDYTFRLKGIYIVHILFDGKYALTYTVNVEDKKTSKQQDITSIATDNGQGG